MLVRNRVEVQLSLSQEESEWLKAVMQNPISEDESESEREMRLSFWSALDGEGVR